MTKKINYVEGDATTPRGDGKKIIIHVCNDIGVWGGGFVLALSKKWSITEDIYKDEHGSVGSTLGHVSIISVGDDIEVANMIGQTGTSPDRDGRPPVRYGAIALCLEEVAKHALISGASIHAPRFGSGLAGGEWDKIEELINEELISKGIDVTIYDLPVPYPKQVIVMRRKYPDGAGGTRKLRTGKMVAQGAHASMAVMLNAMSNHVVEGINDMTNDTIFGISEIPSVWADWINGNFTKICLYVDSEEELLELEKQANEHGLPNALIKDSGLTEFGGVSTYTALAIGPELSTNIDKITSHLPLL